MHTEGCLFCSLFYTSKMPTSFCCQLPPFDLLEVLRLVSSRRFSEISTGVAGTLRIHTASACIFGNENHRKHCQPMVSLGKSDITWDTDECLFLLESFKWGRLWISGLDFLRALHDLLHFEIEKLGELRFHQFLFFFRYNASNTWLDGLYYWRTNLRWSSVTQSTNLSSN